MDDAMFAQRDRRVREIRVRRRQPTSASAATAAKSRAR
jgi:hypothetical protein